MCEGFIRAERDYRPRLADCVGQPYHLVPSDLIVALLTELAQLEHKRKPLAEGRGAFLFWLKAK